MVIHRHGGAGFLSTVPVVHRAKLSGPQSDSKALRVSAHDVGLLPGRVDRAGGQSPADRRNGSGSLFGRHRDGIGLDACPNAAELYGSLAVHQANSQGDARVRVQSLSRAHKRDGLFPLGSTRNRLLP